MNIHRFQPIFRCIWIVSIISVVGTLLLYRQSDFIQQYLPVIFVILLPSLFVFLLVDLTINRDKKLSPQELKELKEDTWKQMRQFNEKMTIFRVVLIVLLIIFLIFFGIFISD